MLFDVPVDLRGARRGAAARASRYWRHSSTSSASGARSRLSRISTRNRSARSSSAASARLRIAAHQRQHGVDAVEQEMRPDARLQRLQPRLGERRRQRASRAAGSSRAAATARASANDEVTRERPGAAPIESRRQRVDGDARSAHVIARDDSHAPVAVRRRASHGCTSAQQRELERSGAARRIAVSDAHSTPTMRTAAARARARRQRQRR